MKSPKQYTSTQSARLTEFLAAPERPQGTMTYFELAGFLFAVACAPEMIRPSEWIPLVFAEEDGNYKTLEEAQEILGAVMALYNEINNVVMDEVPELPAGCDFRPDPMANFEPDAPLSRWSRGFLVGCDWLQESWDALLPDDLEKELGYALVTLSFFASRDVAEGYRKEMKDAAPVDQVAGTMLEVFADAMGSYARIGRTLFRAGLERRTAVREPVRSVKIGRNDPCPCGSGKKYKKCCGAAVH